MLLSYYACAYLRNGSYANVTSVHGDVFVMLSIKREHMTICNSENLITGRGLSELLVSFNTTARNRGNLIVYLVTVLSGA